MSNYTIISFVRAAVIGVLLVSAACSKENGEENNKHAKPAEKPARITCKQTMDHLRGLLAKEGKQEKLVKLENLCMVDTEKWTQERKRCILGLKSMAELETCRTPAKKGSAKPASPR